MDTVCWTAHAIKESDQAGPATVTGMRKVTAIAPECAPGP